MNKERLKKYKELEEKIGNTPLVKYGGNVPNGNTIWIKRECDNPFGSHYDRVYFALYKHFEENRGLQPGMNVLETTSGTAGVSFAGIGKFLGYDDCYVMVPDGKITQKRREAIQEQGGILIPTPENEWIQGFPKRIGSYKQKLDAKFLNHSMGRRISGTNEYENNETTLSSLEPIAEEVLKQINPDIYVCGIGNGSSVVGPGRIFRQHNPEIQIIGYKPKESGKNDTPGLVNQDGLNPENRIRFPHIREANSIMNKEVIFSHLSANDGLPCWDMELELGNQKDLGRTARAGIAVALAEAKKVHGKNILILGYDNIKRY